MKATAAQVNDYDRDDEDERDNSKHLNPSRSALVVWRWIGHMSVVLCVLRLDDSIQSY
jgi:hypothetical protein